ncbi:MAG: GAF domain-containing protein [Mucilaginibacter sp.]
MKKSNTTAENGRGDPVQDALRDPRERTRIYPYNPEERYRTLFDTIDEGLAIVELERDADGIITGLIYRETNTLFERQTGQTELIGKRASELLPNLEKLLMDSVQAVADTGAPFRTEDYFAVLDRWFDVRLSRVGGQGSPFVAAVLKDITGRKRHEQHQALVSRISKELGALTDSDKTMEYVGEELGNYFGVKWCMFSERNDDNETYSVYGWHAAEVVSLNGTHSLHDYLRAEQAARDNAGELTIVDDTQTDVRTDAGFYTRLGISSFIIVPLSRGGQWNFQLSVIDNKIREWREDEVLLLKDIADRIWVRLEKARAEELLHDREIWLRGQQKAFRAATSGASLAASLEPLIDAVIAQTNGDARAAIYRVSEQSGGLYLVSGMSAAYAQDVNGFKSGPEWLAMHNDGPIITADVNNDPVWEPFRKLARKHNYRACWLFPVSAGGRPVSGILAIYFEMPRKPSAREMEMAGILAHAAAIIISRDHELTERAEAEEALKESEERLKTVLDGVGEPFYVLDKDWCFLFASRSALNMWGKKKEEILGHSFMSCFPEAAGTVPYKAHQRVMMTGVAERLETVSPVLNRWLEVDIAPTPRGGLSVAFRDIERRKQAELTLRQSEEMHRNKLEREVTQRTNELEKSGELLQATLDSNLEMIQVFKAVRDESGKITDFIWILNNHASEQAYGDVIGKSLVKNNPGVIKSGIFDKFVEVTETGVPQQYERHYVNEQFSGWFHQSVVKLGDGVGTNTVNLTERKIAELQLKDSRDQLQSILDTTLVQMSILEAVRDKKGTIADLKIKVVNKEMEKVTGRADLVGKFYLKEYPGIKQAGLFDLIVKTIETGEPQQLEYFYPYDGFNKWFAGMFVKLNDGVVSTTMDISDRKLAEEKLRKMEAGQQREIFRASLGSLEEERRRISESLHNGLGQLLYGIKINLNHLTGEQAAADPETFRANKKYTDELLTKAIRESRRISHELMPAMLEDFGLEAAIEDICKQFSDGVRFSCNCKGLNKRLDKDMELAIYRMVQELMTNIIKHAKATDASTEVVKEDSRVLLTVKDNGIGYKAPGKSDTGIGLASIRSKVRLLNGHVTIESSARNGTTVIVEIPLK